jgi:hypothetical protein
MAQVTNINPIYNANGFTLSGASELLPVIETSQKGTRYAKIYLVQRRYAGADYKEFKRFFNIVTFDEDVIELLEQQKKQFVCTLKGEMTTGKMDGYYQTNLICKSITIDEVLDKDFDDNVKTEGVVRIKSFDDAPLPKKNMLDLDDADLPF